MRKEEIIDFFENHGFAINDISECFDEPTPICWEIVTESDAGEALINTIQCNDSLHEFRKGLLKIWENFDIEEHVLDLLEAKKNGMRGIPDVVTLVEDAQKIDKMYESLYDDFYNTFCLY